jgi:hypothetical protein
MGADDLIDIWRPRTVDRVDMNLPRSVPIRLSELSDPTLWVTMWERALRECGSRTDNLGPPFLCAAAALYSVMKASEAGNQLALLQPASASDRSRIVLPFDLTQGLSKRVRELQIPLLRQ